MVVTRADGAVTRIGPILTPDVADAIHTSLTRYTTIPEQAAATAEIVPFAPEMLHLPLLDAEAGTLLALMDDGEQGVQAPFPNVWDRLVAQHGLGTADTVWKEALAARQTHRHHTPTAGAQRASRAQADDRFDHALRELLLASIGPGGISPAALDDTLAGIRRLADDWARSRQLPSPGR
ncbi:hypothetical protein OG883_44810 [Streptomyces sp. NBC_01142]|uniref:hypothetical protein n=1 Tax=Streptomyces sp. NBC_01142 TaxID=2975865 RepID=UPI002256F0B3|nr:hypothetical protein [Streptomyces sp. NBC_01142]MCX4826767.1 hypothetical protein [Streptomyces sp. NBC_01142]